MKSRPLTSSRQRRRRGRSARRRPHILCIDDNRGIRFVVCQVLAHAGFNCETVADGEAALARLLEIPGEVDVVVTDHNMPRLDGLALVAELRHRGFDRRIIVHSSWLRAAERAAYEALHVDAFLTKPVDSSVLLQTISEFSQKRQG